MLYLDQGKHMLHYDYYYGKGDITVLSLVQWKNSEKPGPAPYFITNPARIKESGIEGNIIIKQQSDKADADDTRVLFQLTPSPDFPLPPDT